MEHLHVLPEHEEALREFVERARRFGRPFLLSVLAFTLGMVAAVVLGSLDVWSSPVTAGIAGTLLSLLGLLLVIFPFATPETVQAFGVCRSILIVRVLGLLALVAGIVMM